MSGGWPKFHGNGANTGRSSTSGPAGGVTGWAYLAGGLVTGSPVTASGGNIYFVCPDGYLYCLNRDGVLQWQYNLHSAGIGAPAIAANGTIYAGSDLTYLYALDSNGTLHWRQSLGGKVKSSPAIGYDGTVYAGCDDGKLYALDTTGGIKWSYTTGGPVNSSPAIGPTGVIYVGSDDTYLYAINSNGTLKWRYHSPAAIPNAPAVDSAGVIYATCANGRVIALNTNGTLKWGYTVPAQIASSPAIGPSGSIYFGADDSRLYALSSTGSLSWSYLTTGAVRSSPAVGSNGVVYVGSQDGSVYAVNPDGSGLWSTNVGGPVSSSPAIASDGTLVVGAGDSRLHTFPPDSTPPSTPVVTDDGIYAPSSSSLHASWVSSDPESGVAESQYAVGSSPGATDVAGWTSVGTAFQVTRTGLSLVNGATYFFAVKTRNGAGLWSTVGVSDGIIVDSSPASTPVVVDDGQYITAGNTLHAIWNAIDAQSGIAEYQYAIGTTAGGTTVVGWTSAGTALEITRSDLALTDGTTYYFSVKARNGSGLWSAAGNSDGIMVDSSPPSAPVVTDDGAYTSSTTTLHATWAASDPHSGIGEYQYAVGTSVGGTDVVNWTSTGTAATITRSGLSLTNGATYYFSVKARNSAGLWSSVGVSDGILCDSTPPSTPVVVDDGAYTSSLTTLHATWSSADPESGIASYQYAIGTSSGGTNTVNWTSVGTATEINRTGLTLTQGATYYVSVRSTNGSGLTSSVGSSDGILCDNTAPSTPVVTDDGAYTSSVTTLHAIWNAADAQSGISEYQYAIGTTAGGTNVVNWTSTGALLEITRSDLSLADGTTYYFSVKARNGSGLWSAAGNSDGIMVDSSPPTTPVVTDDGAYTSSTTTLHATWSASDPHSGIGEYQYAIGTSSGATDVVNWTSTGTAATITRTGLTLTNGTTYYFSVKARNSAGLWSAVGSSDGILCDSTPPTTPVVVDDGAYTSSLTTLHATWSSTDPESGIANYQYAIGTTAGGTTVVNWTSMGTATEVTRTGLSLSQGATYYISVRSTNGSGLTSGTGSSDGIMCDNTAPSAPVVTDDGAYTSSVTTLHAIWNAADAQSGISEYQYAIGTTVGGTNVVNWTSTGALLEITRSDLSLADGTTYYFSVKARNGSGLWSAAGNSDGILCDSTPPSTPVVTDDGAYTSSTTTLHATWTASDPHSGIGEYQYAIGTSSGATDVVNWTSTGTAATITRTGLTLTNGTTYYFSVKARNSAGLWSAAGNSDGILCDSTPPSTPVVVDDGAYTSSLTTLHATWSSTDPESGISSYQYAIGITPGGTTVANWTSVGTATEVTRTGLTLTQGLTYYVSVRATNGSGLTSSTGSSDGIMCDNTAPSQPVVTDDGAYTSSITTLHASWTASDAQSGISEYQYAIGTTAGGTNVVNWTSAGALLEITRSDLSLTDGTTYYFSVKARNGSGLWSAVGSSDGITVDSSPPTIPVVTDDGAYTSSTTTLHANWTASDPHSGIAEYQYAIGTSSGATDVVNWTSTGAAATITRTGLALINGTTYYFSVKARNSAGLWSAAGNSDGIMCDSTPPSTPAVTDDGAYTSSLTTLHATWSSADPESGISSYQYAIGTTAGGTTVVTWTSVGTATEVTRTGLTLTQGSTYYISVRSTNGSGLTSSTGSSDGIMCDNTAPSTPVVTDDGAYTSSVTTLHASWTAADAQSGISEYQYAIGTTAGGTNVVNWTSAGALLEITRSDLSLTDGTTYYFSVKARNGSGLWSAAGSSDGITVDSSPPTIPVVTDDGAYTSSTTTLHANWTASDPHSGIGEYQYAIGTSAGATDVVNWTSTGTAATITRTGLALINGTTYYFSVKARNSAGLWSAAGNSDGIMCDSTPPSTPVVVDDGAYTSSLTTLHATWSSADPESGISSYQYAIGTSAGGTNTVNWTSVGTATEVTRTGLSLSQGSTYYISVRATNGSGLTSSTGSSDGIMCDNTAPSQPVVTDDGVYSTSPTSLHATWSAADTQSGIAEYQYAIGTSAGGTDTADWTSALTATTITRTGLPLVDGTTYYFSVKARNGSGLWSAVGSSDGIMVDSSAPSTPVVVDDGSFTTSPTMLHATWSASDPHSGISEFQYAIGTSAGATDVVNWASVGTGTSITRNDMSLVGGTTYYFSVKARNRAGLWSLVGISDGIICDGTPPTTPIVVDDGVYTSSATTLHATWSSTDPESGIANYQYAIGTSSGGTNVLAWTSVGTATEVTRTGLTLVQGSTYYISVRATNGSGQLSSVGSSDGITVDTTAPSVPVVTDDGVYSTSPTTLHATWSASDAQSGIAEYQYAIGTTAGATNLVNWTSIGTGTSVARNDLALVDGTTYWFSVKARNGSGLWSAVGSSDGIMVDSSPPTTPVVTDDGAYTSSTTTLHATWLASDPHSGIVEYQYAIGTSSGAANIVNWTSAGTGTSVTRTDLSLAFGTYYYFAVRAKNGVGLWSVTGVSDGIGVDQTPPSAPTVTDEGDFTSSMTSLSAQWVAIDPESGIAEYQYCIGTIAGGTDVVGWTSAGSASHITRPGLSLTADMIYYFAVRAKNGVGQWGPVGLSDGITVRILTTWPKFRSDSSNRGASFFTGPAVPGLLTSYATGSGIVSSVAIAGDGTLYFGTDSGSMYSVGPSGILHWKYDTGGPIDSSPAIGENGAVVFGSYDSYIYCLTSDGGLRWKYKTDDWVRSSPVIGPDNSVYIGSEDGCLYALQWNGTLKWKYRIPVNGSGFPAVWSSPALSPDGSTLYFGAGDGGIYALDTATGGKKWKKSTTTAVDSSPCVGPDGTIYVGAGDGYFYALWPNGSEKWKFNTGTVVDSSAAIGPDGTIYVGCGDGYSDPFARLYAFTSGGAVKWAFDPHSSIRTSPAVDAAGVVYFGATDNYVYAVNSNGTQRWRYLSDEPFYSSPAIGRGGRICIGSSGGVMLTLGDSSNDSTPPTVPIVSDAGATTTDSTKLSASWQASDPESGIAEYSYAIGTLPGTDDVVAWASAGTSTSILKTGLHLSIGQTYYFCVKARNGAGKWGAAGTSDGIEVVSANTEISIGLARQLTQATDVYLSGKVVTAVFGDCIYVQEPTRHAGIKIDYGALGPPAVGASVSLTGTTVAGEAEPTVTLRTFSVDGNPGEPRPLGLSCKAMVGGPCRPGSPSVEGASGTSNTGILAAVWGKVSAVGSGCFFVDDGSGVIDPSGEHGVKVNVGWAAPSPGTYVRVVGVVSVEPVGLSYRRLIRPRRQSDITTLSLGAN